MQSDLILISSTNCRGLPFEIGTVASIMTPSCSNTFLTAVQNERLSNSILPISSSTITAFFDDITGNTVLSKDPMSTLYRPTTGIPCSLSKGNE